MTAPHEYTQEFVDHDGERIGVHIYPEPVAAPGKAPVVVIWPAMGVRAGYYRPFAAQLREAGLAVVVVDLRGTGSSSPAPSRASRYGYAELVDDVGAVLAALKPRLDGRTRLLLGHSLGGQAALLHLALNDDQAVDGLALVAVGLPYWRRYPNGRGRMVLPYSQTIAATARMLGVWPGWGFGGRQARGVIRDWAYTARTGRFPRLNGVDVEAAVRRLRTPVLAISVDDDPYTPHETLDHLCAKLAAAHVVRERHSAAQADGHNHFGWVRSSAAIAARVAAFATEVGDR